MIYLWYYLFKCPLITVAFGLVCIGLQGALVRESWAPIPSKTAAVWRLESSMGRGVAWGNSLAKPFAEGTTNSGHLQNLELEVFCIYCSPEEMLWSIKKWFLTAGDHYTEHSVGHATAAILPEDGNVFGTAFGEFVPLMLSPSLLLPVLFKMLQEKLASEGIGGHPWAKATLRVGVKIFLWSNTPASSPGAEQSL